MNATMIKNDYRGLDKRIRPCGFNVYLDGSMQIMGISHADATMAVSRVNAAADKMAELRAIHEELRKRY